MVGDIAERLIRNPAVIAVIHAPAAGGVRPPAWIDSGRPPHVAIIAFVIDAFPTAIFFQSIGFVADGFG